MLKKMQNKPENLIEVQPNYLFNLNNLRNFSGKKILFLCLIEHLHRKRLENAYILLVSKTFCIRIVEF